MSPAAYSEPAPVLTAQRGGLAPTAAPVKMHPSEIALTLSTDVLRVPINMNARAVLAEIVSLHAATGCCDASDAHFAARLTINKDTASVAVKLLEAEGLVRKVVVRQPTGFYRTLTPNPAAIAAKAASNPYPENTGSPTRNFRVAQPEIPGSPADTLPGISGQPYPETPATPTRKNPLPLPGNSGSNTPFNSPVNFHQSSISSATASEAPAEKKIKEDFPAQLPAAEVQIVPPVAAPPQPEAPRTRIASDGTTVTRIGPPKKAKPKPEGEPAHFAAFWAAYLRHDKRPDALAAFIRLSPEEQAQAADRATRWLARRADWIGPEGQDYRPYPATWLRNKRWTELDEPLPTPSPATASTHATHSAHSKPGAARHHVPQVTSYGSL